MVAFLDKNHPACVELTFAAASLGAANAIINFRLSADELDYVLNDSGAKVLIVGKELQGNVDKIRDKLTSVEHVIEVTPEGEDGDEYEAMLAAATPTERGDDVDPDDVAIIMYSSGTTGRPKGVQLTQANIIAHTVNAHEGFEFDEGDKNMVSMPLFHVGGSSYVQFGIHDGFPSVMTREVDGASLAGAILKGANRTFLVPAVLAKVLDSGEDAVKLFGALKTYAYGASPMPLPLLRKALEAWPNTDFIQAYGLTEVCGVISHLLPEAHRDPGKEERLTSAGTLVPNAEVRVVDPDTLKDVPTGEQGELWFRSPQLMKGYHNKPEATAESITDDGWFRTGDIGRVDDGGYIFVEDRLKDMIISGGENIYSIEVERVMAEHPAVVDVAIIGIPDDKWGEVVKAVVQLEGDADEKDSIAFAASGWRPTSAPSPSTSATICRATRPARSSRRICASSTRKAATARSVGLNRDRDLVAPPERQRPRRIEEPRDRFAYGFDVVVAAGSSAVHPSDAATAAGLRSPLKRRTA